ncbi:MAG: mechanosensitive ion channel family protein [Proteobacteria bacterium]|nr:mechanosensitive ion channel family protein [Pseudomonadota bacterium]
MRFDKKKLQTIILQAFLVFVGALAFGFIAPGPANAQEADQQIKLTLLTEEVAADFDQRLSEIALQDADIQQFQARVDSSEGLIAQVLEIRRDRLWTSMLQNTLALAKDVADRRDAGEDVSAYQERLAVQSSTLLPEAIVAIQRMRSRVIFPTEKSPPEEIVVDDQILFKQVGAVDNLYRTLMQYVEIAERFDLDASPARDFMTGTLTDTAANRSVFLELAFNDVATLRAASAALPKNAALADRLSAAETRVQMTARAMQEIISLMNALDLNTRLYRQQVLTVTGEVTTDVLDVGIMADLVAGWTATVVEAVASEGPKLLFRLLLVTFIVFVFFQFSKLVRKGAERVLVASRLQISHLLRRMIVSTVRNLVLIFGILIAISQLGISLGPLLAGLGIAGFIIGFALQDSLANFASGIMILLNRPFDVGDTVEAGGVRGKVSHMSLISTTFMTFDNQKLVVPNNMIWGSVITNVTAQRTRRVDQVFGISYGDDIDKAEAVLHEIVEDHDAVLDNPKPLIKVHELGDSSVNFIVRPWVKTEDYWDTYWDLTKAVKLRFDKEGISIPFPQRDVHVFEQKS